MTLGQPGERRRHCADQGREDAEGEGGAVQRGNSSAQQPEATTAGDELPTQPVQLLLKYLALNKCLLVYLTLLKTWRV